MQPRDRLSFSPITKRPALRFPSGIRLVVWPVLALEEWDISRPMARTVISPPQGQPQLPDMPNWSWHEYGMRVGFWRLRKMLGQVGAKPGVSDRAAGLARASRKPTKLSITSRRPALNISVTGFSTMNP